MRSALYYLYKRTVNIPSTAPSNLTLILSLKMDLQNYKDYKKYVQYHLNISNAVSFLENGVRFSEISLLSNFIGQSISQTELEDTKWIG